MLHNYNVRDFLREHIVSNIKVTRTIHIEEPHQGETAAVGNVDYITGDCSTLMESVALGSRRFVRRSEDNGKTWEIVEEWPPEKQIDDDLVLVTGLPTMFYCQSDTGILLRAFCTYQIKPSVLGWDYAKSPIWRTMRIYTQISKDDGHSWFDPRQLIVKGDQYDENHWMDAVYYGKNGGSVQGGRILTSTSGKLIVPFSMSRLFDNGDIVDSTADPATANPDGAVERISGCFIGDWRNGEGDVDWSMGGKVELSKKYSCDGADEPSIEYLDDGRLFMALRARTYPHTGQELPSLHYYALSSDDGRTWGELEPLLYDDGSYAYSPACLIKVLCSSKNGRLYVATNFAEAPCTNVLPRNKLHIAEIDMDTLRIKKNTLTIIEQQDKSTGQPDGIHFSNFAWYEDRQSQDIVLFMTPCVGNCPEHCFRYDIQLPK